MPGATGAIDAYGEPVPESKRRVLRPRAVEVDAKWLKAVLNWATTWQDDHGRYLMRENPVRGYQLPSEPNVRRPVASQDRFDLLRSVSDRVKMENRWAGLRDLQRSYLSELLDLVNGTGRRISAVCQLRYDDLRLDQKPHGAIRWPAATDKQRKEMVVPISATVRAALDRVLSERPGLGLAYLFPSPESPERPITKDRARAWLRQAEKLAELPHIAWGGYHAFRRKWATERKHLPIVDVAAVGGWAGTETLVRCYQQADEATMLAVVLGATQLRERPA
jgi:integrase